MVSAKAGEVSYAKEAILSKFATVLALKSASDQTIADLRPLKIHEQQQAWDVLKAELLKSFSHDHWRFDQNHRSLRLRSIMSEGLIVLVAANTQVDMISKFGFVIRKGFWPRGETNVASFFSSLTAFI